MTTVSAGIEITPFDIAVPDADLADLRDRLARTRWPDRETVDDVRAFFRTVRSGSTPQDQGAPR